jgi:RHS repeat-associated protein
MRRVLVCLLIVGLSVMGVGAWCVGASQASSLPDGAKVLPRARATSRVSLARSGASAAQGGRTGGLSVLSGTLVTPGSPAQGEQMNSQEAADRSNPAAMAEREASRTKFEGLSASQAATVVSESFPSRIDEQAAGPPVLAAGEQVAGYVGDHAARVVLPEGKRGVIESSRPIAVETGPGQWLPVDLSLSESAGSFAAARPSVGLVIPKRLQDGVSLAGSGVSLTPLSSSGMTVGGSEGSIHGTVVFYGGVELGSDVDVTVKPLASGFAEDAILRSERSPRQLSFRLGVPEGASIEQSQGGSGQVVISRAGKPVALVAPPVAQDAMGSPVPVSMSVSGTKLTLAVKASAGEYRYPILVDPTVAATNINDRTWEFLSYGGFIGSQEVGALIDKASGGEKGGYGLWGFETTGESHIYSFTAETEASGEGVENEIAIASKGRGKETSWAHPVSYGNTRTEVCVEGGCSPGKVDSANQANVAYFKQINFQGAFATVTSKMSSGAVHILQEKPPAPKFSVEKEITAEAGLVHLSNVVYNGGWLGPHTSNGFQLATNDPGIGSNEWSLASSSAPGWSEVKESVPCVVCRESIPTYPPVYDVLAFSYSQWYSVKYDQFHNINNPLPDGEDVVQMKAHDAAGLEGLSEPETIKVDATPPYNITLTGLPPNKEIGSGVYHLKASATDGSGSTPSSGVESIALKVDGKQVGSSAWSCSPGPCTATGEWTVSGSEFAVGQHEVTVTATDKADNVAPAQHYTMFVARPTSPFAAGPGSVDPQSGELRLGATDVSVAAPGLSLTVSRGYGSLHTTAGEGGPLGPQWSLSLQGSQNLTKLPDGDMLLTDGTGLQAVFANKGKGEFEAPKGDGNLILTEKGASFALTDASGAVTTFTPAGGAESNVWLPTLREQAGGRNVIKITYQAAGAISEPTEMLAPPPPGVSCSSELVKGCRALKFVYATKTTATGDSDSEWGDCEGHLKEITFTAWDPASGKMITKTVAQYLFDKEGRLRAEWNPLIAVALKTKYAYGPEERVSAISPPGQEPWLLTYGALAGDARTGRTLAVTRPSASTALGNGVAPSNAATPALSTTTPTEGAAFSVSNGSWSNGPLSYSYQWERCHTVEGKESCREILGATNASYTPVTADRGGELRAKVTAINAYGTATSPSNESGVPAEPAVGGYDRTGSELGGEGTAEGQLKKPAGAAVDGNGNLWVADTGNNRLEEFAASGTFLKAVGKEGTGEGQFKEPKSVAIDQEGYVFVADTGNKRIEVLNPEGKYVDGKTLTHPPIALAVGKTTISNTKYDAVYVLQSGSNLIDTYRLNTSNHHELNLLSEFGGGGSGNGQFKEPAGITLNPAAREGTNTKGLVFVADTGNHRVQVLKFKNETGPSLVYNTQFGKNGSEPGQMVSPTGIVVEPNVGKPNIAGDVLVNDPGDGRLQLFSESYGYLHQYPERGALAFTLDQNSQTLYVANGETSVISKWIPGVVQEPAPEPPNPGSSAVTSIDYHVPISGEGAPYAMGTKEVESWGQNDEPVEATAVFPPDEPMGWPAKNYRRASLYYLDAKGHTVNTTSPSGGIATIEYNATNDVVRTLSADNRQAALNEGSKSKEASKLLDSESEYDSTGTKLQSTLGPQHKVKLAHGKEKTGEEVLARDHEQLFYNEGAPEGESYDLVTKTIEGARTTSGEEFDKRETKTSFSGQNNLGWKLRKPTQDTTDPSGLDLTNTAAYEEETGNPTETTMPAGAAENPIPSFALSFGSKGSGESQFESPWGVAVNGKTGNVYVSDYQASRVEELSPDGKFIAWIGTPGTGKGQMTGPEAIAIDPSGNIIVGDHGNERIDEFNEKGEALREFGSKGTGEAQFSGAIEGLTANGNHVWASDTAGNRVEEFSPEGKYESSFGKEGSEGGQFHGPAGITISGTNLFVDDSENHRVQEFTITGEPVRKFGATGHGPGQLERPLGIATDPQSGDLVVSDLQANQLEEFTATGAYVATVGTSGTGNGQLSGPIGLAMSASGTMEVVDQGNSRVESWTAAYAGTHTTQTIYYSSSANSKYPSCGNHPEWAGMPCQTQPAKQPETSGLPSLPVTTFAYNYWLEASEEKETFGPSSRTHKATYDEAGRLKTKTVEATVGTALPQVSLEYNLETGATEKESAEGRTITTVRNRLGEPVSYTDADGNTSTAEWDIDGRPEKTNDGKGTQTFSYDTTSGFLTKLLDSAAGTFTANYDLEGSPLSEGYPNGMTAYYTLNQLGARTALEYKKTTHCSENCVWFSDAAIPSIHGQWLEQTSTLSHQTYEYNNAGVLTQVQNTPAGKGCTTHGYANDPDTSRTSLTMHEPNAKGECSSEAGTSESHTLDSADRLIDPGVGYNALGDITALPAADAGGFELTSSFYADNQLQSLTQNGETIGYNPDPAGRTRETVATGKTTQDLILHYAGGGSSPAWTHETLSGHWTRNITGIGVGLVAVQSNGETPVLELSNLHGDIIGTASLTETETKPLSMTDTSEYGVPTTSTPPKYGWLGTDAVATELPSGVIAMGARSYIPQLGRYLQPDPIPGGSANAYTYVFGDPINNSDPSGAFAAWFTEFSAQNAIEVAEAAAAREAAARQAAEEAARAAAAAANAAANAALFAREAEIQAVLKQSETEEEAETAWGMSEEGGGSLRAHESRVLPQEEESKGFYCSFTDRYWMEHGGWRHTGGEFKSLSAFRNFCEAEADARAAAQEEQRIKGNGEHQKSGGT